MMRIPDIVVRFVSSAPSAAERPPTSPKSPSAAGRKPQAISAKTPGSNTPREIEAWQGTGAK